MNYATVCSGIEAPTVAWHGLGLNPEWFSEIEPFPCKLLKHHYPNVPNLGDMTKLNEHETYRNTTIDLFCGGTPCQSFSIAGLRGGLDDDRGNLALEYCRILIAKRPRWFVWENVPGVFSSNGGKDFACILSAFTGTEVNAAGIGNAGIIQGELYSVAWRVLDAQYFGVPQRRRRVFVVGYTGNNWRAPYAVLFEPENEKVLIEKRLETYPSISALTKTDYKGPSKQRPNLVIPTIKGDRKLTPLEHERLQGFPDNYTNIPGAKDAPRYAAIGNSMAVPVMRWIGERIVLMDKVLNNLKTKAA